MSRRSWLLVLGALLLALVLSAALALHAAESTYPPEQPSSPEVTSTLPHFPSLKVFAEALALVQDDYAEPKTTKDLVYGAIQGAIGTLDAHSSFMTPEDLKELQIETKGKFSGIGIEIAMKDLVLMVVSPIEGTPAYQMGIKPGTRSSRSTASPPRI